VIYVNKKLGHLSQMKKTTLSPGWSSSTTLMLAPQFTKTMYCIYKARWAALVLKIKWSCA